MLFVIKERSNIIFMMDSAELSDKMRADNGDNSLIRADIEAMFAHYKKDSEENIVVEIGRIADENELDAASVKAVFWLYAVLTKFDCLRSISMSMQMKLLPKVMRMVSANMAASGLRAREINSIQNFMQTYINESKRSAADPAYCIDTAVQNIIEALPDINSAREEYRKRPDFMQFIDNIAQLAKGCSDSEYSELIEKFRNDILN